MEIALRGIGSPLYYSHTNLINEEGGKMINLELKKQYFVTLEDGYSEFEYVVNQLLPDSMKDQYDLSEIEECYLFDSKWLVLHKDGIVVKEVDLTEG